MFNKSVITFNYSAYSTLMAYGGPRYSEIHSLVSPHVLPCQWQHLPLFLLLRCSLTGREVIVLRTVHQQKKNSDILLTLIYSSLKLLILDYYVLGGRLLLTLALACRPSLAVLFGSLSKSPSPCFDIAVIAVSGFGKLLHIAHRSPAKQNQSMVPLVNLCKYSFVHNA